MNMDAKMSFRLQSVLFVCVVLVTNGLCAKAPPYIHPCGAPSEACITRAVQDAVVEFAKGAPELGMSPLDPFRVDKVDLVLPGNLKIVLDGGVFTGMRKCFIEKASLIKTTFDLYTRCNITIKGKYKANGRILLFPINGNGDAKIKVVNMKLHVKMFTKNEKSADGKYHVVFKDYKTTHQWGDRVVFHLTNLFQGNPEISNTVLQFLNDNWRQVAEEFGAPLVEVAVERVVANVKKFFAAVPYEELIHYPVTLD